MDRVTLQPGGGLAGDLGQRLHGPRLSRVARRGDQRDEVITTIFSHPSNAACARSPAIEIITLYPDADGYPDLDALKRRSRSGPPPCSSPTPRTSASSTRASRSSSAWSTRRAGSAVYDQANANGILGITRAREAGFDLCHFNLHKTFSTPHALRRARARAPAASRPSWRPFLPVPTVEFDGSRYYLDYDRPDSIGKIRPFYGTRRTSCGPTPGS